MKFITFLVPRLLLSSARQFIIWQELVYSVPRNIDGSESQVDQFVVSELNQLALVSNLGGEHPAFTLHVYVYSKVQ